MSPSVIESRETKQSPYQKGLQLPSITIGEPRYHATSIPSRNRLGSTEVARPGRSSIRSQHRNGTTEHRNTATEEQGPGSGNRRLVRPRNRPWTELARDWLAIAEALFDSMPVVDPRLAELPAQQYFAPVE